MELTRGRPVKLFMTPAIIILDRGPDPQTPRSRHFSTARNQSNYFGAPARAYPSAHGTLPTHLWVQFSPKFEFWATSKFFQPHARPPDPTLAGVMICSTGRPLNGVACCHAAMGVRYHFFEATSHAVMMVADCLSGFLNRVIIFYVSPLLFPLPFQS